MADLRLCSPEPSFPHTPVSIDGRCWVEAEESTQEIIAHVHPSLVSEDRRRLVIDYVQRLITASLGCQVFPFGSVPLRTYLPDGDIDLTVFGGLNVEEALANDVFSILEKEDQNKAAEFVVRDVQLIRAEVKLVKCIVQNIVVDISFNQLGGLCTLCFLEKVDRLIGKDHLFKRGIILIKAWCYYESRILGAHHGLISTYALETLVLYIFHLFHSSLNGPLAVLYKFLDYFSKFNWENYCISLNGPVCITSLPEIVAEMPDNGGGDLLLSNDFLKDCVERFSATSRGSEANSRIFPQKYLNIVDPLKENNNLGRSVSKGNFYRIRSAFTYGARKLERILSQQEENLADEIHKFFSNTLDRHGRGQRPDVQDPIPVFRHNGYGPATPFSGTGFEDQAIFESESRHSGFIPKDCKLEHEKSFHTPQYGSLRVASSLEVDISGIAISNNYISGDAQDLAKDLTIASSASTPSSLNGDNTFSLGRAPHLYFSSSFAGNGEKRKDSSNQDQVASSYILKKKVSSGVLEVVGGTTVLSSSGENHVVNNCEVVSPVGSRHYPPTPRCVPRYQEDDRTRKALSDLGGDFESHIGSLNCGRYWLECGLSNPMMHPQLQRQRNVFPQSNGNGVVPGPLYYPINSPPMMPIVMEDGPKPRGTGTYFPNKNHYRDRPMAMGTRGRNPPAVGLRSPRNFEGARQYECEQRGGYYYDSRDWGVPFPFPGANNNNPLFLAPERSNHPNCGAQVSETTKPKENSRVRSYKLKDNGDFPPLSI